VVIVVNDVVVFVVVVVFFVVIVGFVVAVVLVVNVVVVLEVVVDHLLVVVVEGKIESESRKIQSIMLVQSHCCLQLCKMGGLPLRFANKCLWVAEGTLQLLQ
jgi:hypothetical protein